MAYDYSKLSGKIREVFVTNGKFAKAMGLSERTVSLKMTSKVGWKQEEMDKAMNLLGIPCEEVGTYFFKQKVHS